jgi:hypothetical protein
MMFGMGREESPQDADEPTPAVAPQEPPSGPTITLEVDGEVFSVTQERPNDYGYTWLSGPNEGYGFGVSGPPEDWSLEEHREQIRGFLSMVDPQTGYIEDE